MPDRRRIYQLHALIFGDVLPRITAINRDFIAPGGQALADFLDGGLKPAMLGGHPPRAHQRNLHAPSVRGAGFRAVRC